MSEHVPSFDQAKKRARSVFRALPLFVAMSPSVEQLAKMTGLTEKGVNLGLTWLYREGHIINVKNIAGYRQKTYGPEPLTLLPDL